MIGTAFTVRGQQRMYDPESIRVVSESDERTVIAFAYDRMRVPYPLRHLAKLEGRVVIDGDRLERIELREYETLPVTTTSTLLGVGLSTGFQYESLFGALSAQWATSVVNGTGSELDTLVAAFLVGYDFGDIGLQLRTGAQYQDRDQQIRGEIALGDGQDPLRFDIDLSVNKTVFLVGLYKEIGRSWKVVVLGGFGARDQVTTTIGYRF